MKKNSTIESMGYLDLLTQCGISSVNVRNWFFRNTIFQDLSLSDKHKIVESNKQIDTTLYHLSAFINQAKTRLTAKDTDLNTKNDLREILPNLEKIQLDLSMSYDLLLKKANFPKLDTHRLTN